MSYTHHIHTQLSGISTTSCLRTFLPPAPSHQCPERKSSCHLPSISYTYCFKVLQIGGLDLLLWPLLDCAPNITCQVLFELHLSLQPTLHISFLGTTFLIWNKYLYLLKYVFHRFSSWVWVRIGAKSNQNLLCGTLGLLQPILQIRYSDTALLECS